MSFQVAVEIDRILQKQQPDQLSFPQRQNNVCCFKNYLGNSEIQNVILNSNLKDIERSN